MDLLYPRDRTDGHHITFSSKEAHVSPPQLPSTWPTTTSEEAFWQDIREQFMLAPDEIYLNTGSWGSMPRSVFGCLVEGLAQLERNPTANRGALYNRATGARARLGRFVNAPPEDLAFTMNVTVAVHGLDWQPGDEILASDQEYGAIDNCLHHAQQRWGVVVRRAHIPIPPASPEDVLNAFDEAFTERTRLVVCSHIATRTGLIVPLKRLADLAHARGARIAVDGAHAPGMIPLDLQASGCDFYGGNCHKWLCAPKGTGFLYASPEAQERLHHIVVSWGYSREGTQKGENGRPKIGNCPFMWGLENWGTRDLASLAAVGEAVGFQERIGAARIAARGRLLAGYLRERMSQTGWAELVSPSRPDMSGLISTFRLCGFDPPNLGKALYDRYRISTPVFSGEEYATPRVSTHLYNSFEQIDRLMDALAEIRMIP